MTPMGMFHFTGIVVTAATLAILDLWLIAPRLAPNRTPPMQDTSPRVFEAVLHIGKNSAAAGCTIPELIGRTEGAMRLGAIERGPGLFVAKLPSVTIRAGDQRLAEIVVTRGSPLHRRTLKTVPFFAHHGLLPVAVQRPRSWPPRRSACYRSASRRCAACSPW